MYTLQSWNNVNWKDFCSLIPSSKKNQATIKRQSSDTGKTENDLQNKKFTIYDIFWIESCMKRRNGKPLNSSSYLCRIIFRNSFAFLAIVLVLVYVSISTVYVVSDSGENDISGYSINMELDDDDELMMVMGRWNDE
ncbi:uncharacterized protein BX664DRAFT_381578 [Halteromyces radiatus]|uniref:uncharacterized protein n=1 Tax=Halteromyces radiatus TaxID=101107 RepID=UPI00221F2A8A|nr:uncharacterized protein BX664DRAFT_381578 [Halteromyces radiatus]KAI8098938.1 hypothetical protein BX664DRAFT_381578 [Halteromyces radiatus]